MTSFVLSRGTWPRWTKKIVFVPVFRPGMPCARRPILFQYKCAHTALVLRFTIGWQYSRSLSLSPITKLAISQNQVIGSLRCDICWGDTLIGGPLRFGILAKFSRPRSLDRTYCGLQMSTHNNIASCIMLRDLVVHLSGVGLSSLSCEM